MVISRLTDVTVPIDRTTVRSDAEPLVQSLLGGCDERSIGEVQAPVSWKFNIHHFFDLLINGVYASDFLAPGHGWPFLMQLNTGGVLHDDIFATNSVGSIIAPVKDIRYRNAGIGLHYDAADGYSCDITLLWWIDLHSRYLIVPTSELVISLGGPAMVKGNLATIRCALLVVKMKIRLKPPSFFSQVAIEVALGHNSITLRQSASKSNAM